ncbi:MAG: hypothetical protein INR65_07115 [Gluconacetobacter diazotrophicus]|nr:hypothetical protein [Gluconacetobacter diazotrophicus]
MRRALVSWWMMALAAMTAAGTVPAGAAVGPDERRDVMLVRDGRETGMLSPEAYAALPREEVRLDADPEHRQPAREFSGPTLWDVLKRTGLEDGADAHGVVRRVLVLRGRDGYAAVLAEAEIAPEFGDKTVILADRMGSELLGTDHLRAVVPGDRRAGRSVRDLARIELDTVAPPKPGGMRPQ